MSRRRKWVSSWRRGAPRGALWGGAPVEGSQGGADRPAWGRAERGRGPAWADGAGPSGPPAPGTAPAGSLLSLPAPAAEPAAEPEVIAHIPQEDPRRAQQPQDQEELGEGEENPPDSAGASGWTAFWTRLRPGGRGLGLGWAAGGRRGLGDRRRIGEDHRVGGDGQLDWCLGRPRMGEQGKGTASRRGEGAARQYSATGRRSGPG